VLLIEDGRLAILRGRFSKNFITFYSQID